MKSIETNNNIDLAINCPSCGKSWKGESFYIHYKKKLMENKGYKHSYQLTIDDRFEIADRVAKKLPKTHFCNCLELPGDEVKLLFLQYEQENKDCLDDLSMSMLRDAIEKETVKFYQCPYCGTVINSIQIEEINNQSNIWKKDILKKAQQWARLNYATFLGGLKSFLGRMYTKTK